MKRLCLLLATFVLCSSANAAKFYTIEGQEIEGELRSVDDAGSIAVKLPGEKETRISADDLLTIEFSEGREPDLLAEGVIVYLPGGDKICGTLARSSASAVEVVSGSLGKLALPIEKLIAIEFSRLGDQPRDAAEMRARLLGNDSKDDIAISNTGDQMPGILVSFEGDTVVINAPAGEMSLKIPRLFGLAFAARKRASPPSLLACVRCVDGSVVTGLLRPSQGGNIRLALLAGPEVEIAGTSLIDLGFKQGKLVYLSDLKPDGEKYTPFFGGDRTWPYQPDRNYDRGPLRMAGKTYRKGVGTFSGTSLTYNLGGEFKKFAALVGIDEADVNHMGDVTVRVLADGKEVFQKAELTRKAGPVKIDLPVEGVKTLQLLVEFGGNMHFGDFTDWAEAHLIR